MVIADEIEFYEYKIKIISFHNILGGTQCKLGRF